MSLTKATFSMIDGATVNVLDFGAVGDGVTDDTAAILAAIASVTSPTRLSVYFPRGTYLVSGTISANIAKLRLFGDGAGISFIEAVGGGGFTGTSVIEIVNGQQVIQELSVIGQSTIDCIRVTDGSFSTIENVNVKDGLAGVRLIRGNLQYWSNILAESCGTGFLVVPLVGTDTNGGIYSGLRAYGCTTRGIDLQLGGSTFGSLYGTWDVYAEACARGLRVTGGLYNHITAYVEGSTTGTVNNFELAASGANYFFLKNPDNDDELFGTSTTAMGVQTTGTNMYFDGCWSPERVTTQDFTVSGSLGGVGVRAFNVTNSSSPPATLQIYLGFMEYAPVGTRAVITKLDNTPGFTLTVGGGVSLIGNTGTFGSSATDAVLEVVKIDSATVICLQY
jgi:hypothetical protein